MPQTLSLHAYMTASEILNFYGMIYHLPKCIIQQQMTLLAILGVDKIKDRRISTWSSGQQRRISLCIALLHSPKLLILDEPTVGIDPIVQESIWNYLTNMVKTKDVTILVTTHRY